MKSWFLTAGLASLIVATAAHAAPDPAAAANAAVVGAETSIAWYAGDLEDAFRAARATGKPLFLYWGAEWCPPCNQVRSTIFRRHEFVERSRLFVAYYLDGDSPNAQKLAERFKVTGYPTMILFRPDGVEVTRLPGEVDSAQYMQALELGMDAVRPARAALAEALGEHGGDAMSAQDWRLLAYYAWDTDDGQLVDRRHLAETLVRLARACPPRLQAVAARLTLRALLQQAGDAAPLSGADKRALRVPLQGLLSDPARSRELFDLLVAYPTEIIDFLTAAGSDDRRRLDAAWDEALARFAADASLSNADRLSALDARVVLAHRHGLGAALPPALLDQVVAQVADADRTTRDRFERHAVVSAGADLLAEAGLLEQSDALLRKELARSQAPYYFMLALASNALKRGDVAGALDWHEQAYGAAQGPATRLQWGSTYVRALLQLAPSDSGRIERALDSVVDGLEPTPDTFYKRNRDALERVRTNLAAWNRRHEHDALLARVQARLEEVCDKLPAAAPERSTCNGALRTATTLARNP